MRQQQLKFGLEGKSQLRLGAMVNEAWQLSRRPNPWFILLALLWFVIIYGGVTQLPELLMAQGLEQQQAKNLAALLATMIAAPISASLDVMGLKVALGQRADSLTLRQCVAQSWRIITLTLLFSLLVDLGLTLLLPGLFLLICSSLSNLVLLYFGANPFNALVWTIRAVFYRFSVVAGVLLGGAFAMALGAMSFGVLLIWLAPFAMILRGILFRELFGISAQGAEPSAHQATVSRPVGDNYFDA